LNELQGIWRVLGIAPTSDVRALRRAYLRKLKVTNPEDDAAAFQELREAYEWALQIAPYERESAPESAESAELAEPAPSAAQPAGTASPPAESATQLAESVAQRTESAAPTLPAPASDPMLEQVQSDLDLLERQLESDAELDESLARRRLDKILGDENLQRLDILQLVDQRLASLLARTLPRSHGLLEPASRRLDWPGRGEDVSRPPEAAEVLQRIDDIAYLQKLESGEGEAGAAWRRLLQPGRPVERWLNAHLLNHSSWDELDLLDSLAYRHPVLLERLDPENVAWWRRFESRPRISGIAIAISIAAVFFISLVVYADGKQEADNTPLFSLVAAGLGILAAVGLVRIYLIEWPILLAERIWEGYPPPRFRVGWLGSCQALLLLALLTKNSPWLGWIVAALAVLNACWASVASGRAKPAFHIDPDRAGLMNARLTRIVVYNALAGIWLALAAHEFGDALGTPLVVTVAAVLAASALGRAPLSEWFEQELTVQQQRAACGAALAATVLLAFALLAAGADAGWQPLLFIAVIACIVLRRSVVMAVDISELFGRFTWLWLLLGFNIVRLLADTVADSLGLGKGTDEILVGGGLFFLAGVGFTAVRRLMALRV
jgi:hypothetical protein